MHRRTLAAAVSRVGVGIHTAQRAHVRLEPAPWGTGLVFVRDGVRIPATWAHAAAVPGAMTLRAGGTVVHTPEHLLAALRGLGVSDALVHVDGPEVPALDGSALGWVEAIDEAGRVDGPELARVALQAGRVEGQGGSVVVEPGSFSLTVVVDFPGIHGTATWTGDEATFREHIAPARTFVMAGDVETLQAMGRGKGATADNTLVVGVGVPRFATEPVAHKLLDAIGDFALAPPFTGRVVVERGSHRLHQQAMEALIQL
jgi:UDP-3-O-acyl-N-acetylglucosamine deacetylase